ncbi:MAG: AAA family ATPase [Candidatus Promineofilum sp.]|nr:AAA family ATPase [Promineifilum sp.]
MSGLNRAQLQQAIDYLAGQQALLGEAAVLTTLEVLEEQLAALPEEPAGREAIDTRPGEQRKQVTILFAAIDGFTRLSGTTRNTARLRQIDLLWRRLDETILSHGGVVDKHMGDVIMGIFGAPISREDDPERAVRCAMALRELVAEFLAEQAATDENDNPLLSNSVMRIGINTGQVSLGPVGSDFGHTVIGDAVNVASRLRETAHESGIYISRDTYRLIQNLFRVEALGEVSIKGRQTPIQVYRVVGVLPRLFFPTSEGVEGVHVPMVGRERETAVLGQMLQQAVVEERGGLITILGDAGVGKSRLVREFYRHLEQYPFKPTIFQARTDQRLTGVPFSLLRDLLIRHFGIADGDRAALIREKIANGLSAMLPHYSGKDLEELARIIGLLVGLEAVATQAPGEAGSPHVVETKERAVESILEYLDAVIRRSPVSLMFLEDVHWADEDSLALLERVASLTADRSLLILCLARPMFLERRPGWPGEQPLGALHLSLRPLDERDSRDLVLSILRKLPTVPPTLADLIIRSAAGNPYYVEELVRVLIEDGIIVPDQVAWQLRPREFTRLRVPGTLTGVLQARLDRLPEVERMTLQQAAVIGDEFWAGAVQLISRAARFPFSEERVTDALASLERRDMIVRASAPDVAGGRAYLFRHTVLREVAYESILLRDRSGYHLQAVRWLESQMGGRTAEYAAPIAQHYEQAGRSADAARLYEQAADRAAEQFRLLAAIDYYRKVLDLLKNLPQHLETRPGVLARLGRLLQLRGRLVEALDTYRMKHEGAELDGNLLGQARARNAQAVIFIELDEQQEALAAAAEAEQLARLTGANAEVVRAQLLQGEAAGRLGDGVAAAHILERILDSERTTDAPQAAARALGLLAAFAPEPQAGDRAVAALCALAEEMERDGRGDDAAYVARQAGEALLSRDQPHEALGYFQRALDRQRTAGMTRAAAELLQLSGTAACRAGNPAEAVRFLEEAEALAESTGYRYLRLGCRLAVGEALLALERYAAAEATLRQVIAMADDRLRLGSWVHRRRAYDLLALVLTRQGRPDEARLLAK